jgi:lipocalin-like protein
MPTLTATDLRKYIVGAWTLESYESSAIDGSDVRYPLGTNAKGIIMYTADGYMSAQIMRADRPEFHTADLSTADKDELAAAAAGYLAYSGPYSVSDDGVLAHHVDVSLLPNWVGGTQYRAAQTPDSRLELSPTEPVLIDGQPRNGRLIWRHP